MFQETQEENIFISPAIQSFLRLFIPSLKWLNILMSLAYPINIVLPREFIYYAPFISIQVIETGRSQGKDQQSFLIKHFLYTSLFNQLVQPTQTFVHHLLFVTYRVLGTVLSANRTSMNTYV